MNYILYMHVNKINDKMYIGITSRTPELRFGKNGSGYIHCDKFWKAINKYGWDNFEHIIMLENLTKEEACFLEKDFIKYYNTINEGYNINEGGLICKHSEETKEKIRNKNLGKVVSEETKEKIRQARAKQIVSYESILKSAEKNKGKKRSQEFKNKSKEIKKEFMKKVYCYNNKKTYDSISDAARNLNINKSSISSVCNKKTKQTKGYYFDFI